MLAFTDDPRIQQILTLPEDSDPQWRLDLERFKQGDVTLDRKTAGENTIKAIQRLLIFLGYSTSSSGAFSIDGDFGRGTNRAVAQFQFEHGLNPDVKRSALGYPCTFQTAKTEIVNIPDVKLDQRTAEKMLEVAIQSIENKHVNCGSFEEAIFHLNSLQRNAFLTCRKIWERYGPAVQVAVQRIKAEKNVTIQQEWILSVIRQETAGVVRPRFEQHIFSKLNREMPNAEVSELRYRSMSFGLGQIMGANFKGIGAPSAKAMFTSPIEDQLLYVGKFLCQSSVLRGVVAKKAPAAQDFRTLARIYNGPGFAKHHYHESIARWFGEFRSIMG
ncbi:MAG: DUF3380 domain-containing protein [Saprospiraceae bacterium]|nr:DUF3380 domain-containing protein [Saprospiraceae bacterium]